MSENLKLNFYKSEQKIHRLLDKDGVWLYPKKKPPLTVEQVKFAFKHMLLSRMIDDKKLKMQRQGRMLTFAPNMGEEALQAATAMAMGKEDVLVPAFRSGLAMIMLGVPISNELLFWNGNEIGASFPEGVNVLPFNITIGTQMSHAGGVGWALRMDDKDAAAISFIGDGGTAEGEFYEALNFATIHKAKWVACINNNQFAISTRIDLESGVEDLSIKAIAAGAYFVRVDGNDLFASYEAMKEALNFTKSKDGRPILVEFVTYRLGPHTTSDDPSVYLRDGEHEKGAATDPLIRTRKWLMDQKAWSKEEEEKVSAENEKLIDSEIKIMEARLMTDFNDIFDHTYAELTTDLARQKKEAKARFEARGN